jgi:pimeloyl-ACP methyl ester carboxylesterase
VSAQVLDSFVEVPGGRVFVRRWAAGHGERDPIILLHDSLGSVEQWRDFPDALAAATGEDVIAYDRLGFGRSMQRSQRPSVDFISEEAVTFFPPIRRALGTLAGIRSAKAQFCVRDQFEKLARWHGDNPRWVLDVWTEVWLLPEFSSWDIDRCLLEVTCPVLAIHGDSDEFGSVEFPRRITSKVKGLGELAILAHCGHVPHRERKAEVLRLTASFLDQRAAGSR